MDPPEVIDSPHLLPSSPPTSNTQLAALLSEAFRDVDSLRRDLTVAKKRAEKAERLIQTLTSDPTGSPSAHPNGNPQDQQQKHAQTVKRLIEDYEDRLAQAEMAREEAEARRRVMQESWEQVDRYLALAESRTKDARIAFTRISEGSVAPLVLPLLPPHIGSAGGSLSTYPPSSSSQVMAPPNVPSRQHSRHQQSSRAFPSLPPHPIPNLSPNLSPNAGTRRPRTPSMDGLYNSAQPPPKRSRANTDEQRAREPRSSYSESVCVHRLVICLIDRWLIFILYPYFTNYCEYFLTISERSEVSCLSSRFSMLAVCSNSSIYPIPLILVITKSNSWHERASNN